MTPKMKILKNNGTLNPHPGKVSDIQFKTHDFFDPYDLLQVKYEMVRRVHYESWSITRATQAFGLSRPSFYQAQEAFEKEGLYGLLPQKRGPKKAHKVSKEVMDFVQNQRELNPKKSMTSLVKDIKKQFGISIHRRSIERAFSKHQKKQNRSR
jgi:transposase